MKTHSLCFLFISLAFSFSFAYANEQQPLQLSIQSGKTRYSPDEEIAIEYVIKNFSKEPVKFRRYSRGLCECFFTSKVINAAEKQIVPNGSQGGFSVSCYDGYTEFVELQPRKKFVGTENIKGLSHGKYLVSIKYCPQKRFTTLECEKDDSNEMKLYCDQYEKSMNGAFIDCLDSNTIEIDVEDKARR